MAQQWPQGVQLIGAGAAANPRYSSVLFPSLRIDVERALAAAKAALGSQDFAAVWATGQGMTLDQAVPYALNDGISEQ
jgi:hypothetical protein